RLVIHKMVLEDFKSCAGVQEFGPFDENFSAVVGPNNSGKSNVMDAMLFVFGKRAEEMRQTKVADLIHRSEQFPELPSAKVAVHFAHIYSRDGSEYVVVPGNELEVSRVAYRNSSCESFVNGNPFSFSEVVAFCEAFGVDLDHQIMHGELEQIAAMKSEAPSPHEEGLLDYLEDPIGSNRHAEPSP
ncbi:RecF/RecN/SMC N terminal domain-containing protein, partial [Pavlovales sp. CCMP2436]